jgi:hypothetical protein
MHLPALTKSQIQDKSANLRIPTIKFASFCLCWTSGGALLTTLKSWRSPSHAQHVRALGVCLCVLEELYSTVGGIVGGSVGGSVGGIVQQLLLVPKWLLNGSLTELTKCVGRASLASSIWGMAAFQFHRQQQTYY